MNPFVALMLISITLVITLANKSTKAYTSNASTTSLIGNETVYNIEAQAKELAEAQAHFYKIYKRYPTDIDEIISKGLLRNNFQTTKHSKYITLDANHNVTITSKNDFAVGYVQGNIDRMNTHYQKIINQEKLNQDANRTLDATTQSQALNRNF